MQLTIDITNLNVEQITHVEAIVRLQREKYERRDANNSEKFLRLIPEDITPQFPTSNQPTLPFDGEVDTTVSKEPIKKRTVKPKEVSTSDEKPKEVAEPTQEVKTSSVGLQEVKELAQTMVAKHDRESVKAIISVYGEKLTEVKESDYQNLFNALNALND